MNQSMVGSFVDAVDEAVKQLDLDRVSREYWEQNEFLFLPQFLSRSLVEERELLHGDREGPAFSRSVSIRDLHRILEPSGAGQAQSLS
jgi:hypothetical protein